MERFLWLSTSNQYIIIMTNVLLSVEKKNYISVSFQMWP